MVRFDNKVAPVSDGTRDQGGAEARLVVVEVRRW